MVGTQNQPSSVTFSVVIPAHNGEHYIAAAIDSVLRQTYPHFRLFVLESGSVDRTLEIVQSYDDPRLNLVTTHTSLGICNNWARILDLDLAPYLTIMGQDDVLYPNFLAEIARLIEAEPAASLYTTHFDLIDSQGELRRPCHPMPPREDTDEWLFELHRFRRDSFGAGYVMRTDDYRRLGGFSLFPALLFADHMTAYRFSRVAYKVCSPARAFAFRVHDQSASHCVALTEVYEAAGCYLDELAQAGHLDNPAWRDAAITYVTFTYRTHHHRSLAELIRSGDAAQRQQYQRVKATMLRDQMPWFEVYDRPAHIYERLAYVRPRFFRRAIYQLVKLTRWYRRRTLQRRLNALGQLFR